MLRQATKHIAERGLEGLDVRGLAEAAGTSTSQYSKFYADRAHLLAAVFDQGWQALEHHVFPHLLRTSGSIEEKIIAILEGVLDALDRNTNEVSATLIIVLATTGHSVRTQLKEKPAHARFHEVVSALRSDVVERLSAEDAEEALELLYGAVLRRLVLLTPLCQSTTRPFDRAVFLRMVRGMVRGLLEADERQSEVAPSAKPAAPPHAT